MKHRWLWRTLGLLALAVALYTAFPGTPPAGPDNSSELGGIYTVNGVDPTGAEYSGTLVIVATGDPDRYELEWIITGTLRSGTGNHRGDRLEVTWASDVSASGPARGTGSYVIHDDGRMTGTWIVETAPDGSDDATSGSDGGTTGTEEVFPEA